MSPAVKPNFKKKDPTNGDDKNERIWKDDISSQSNLREPPVVPNSMPLQTNQHKEEQPVDPPKPAATDNSKPAFILKKRNNNSNLNNAMIDSEPQQPVRDIPKQEEQPISIKTKVDSQPLPPPAK